MDTFDQDYYSRELTEKTYEHKKTYNSNVFVTFADHNFVINTNSQLPFFTCFIKQKGEQFGDVLPVEEPSDCYLIRLFGSSNNIVLNEEMESVGEYLGEYRYCFDKYDLNDVGILSGQIISVDNDEESILGTFKINVV